jgi:hypothetical protein
VGFHSATALLRSLEETQSLLVNLMGMKLLNKESNRYRFKMTRDDSLGNFYDVVVDPCGVRLKAVFRNCNPIAKGR